MYQPNNAAKGSYRQRSVSSHQFAIHVLNRCVSKCYRFVLPRNMRSKLGRYRQVFFALILITVLNMAFWAGFMSSRLSNSYRPTVSRDTLDLRTENSQQRNQPLWGTQWAFVIRKRLDETIKSHKRKKRLKPRYPYKIKPTYGNQRILPLRAELDEHVQRKTTKAPITKSLLSYHSKEERVHASKSKRKETIPISTEVSTTDSKDVSNFHDNDIGAENIADKLPLPSQMSNVEVMSTNKRIQTDNVESKRLAVTAVTAADMRITESKIRRKVQPHKGIDTANEAIVITIQPEKQYAYDIKNNEVEKIHTKNEIGFKVNKEDANYNNENIDEEDNPSNTITPSSRYKQNNFQGTNQKVGVQEEEDYKNHQNSTTTKDNTSLYAEYSRKDDKKISKVTKLSNETTPYPRQDVDTKDRKQTDSFAEDENEDNEDQNDEEVSPITSRYDPTVPSNKPITHELPQIVRNQENNNPANEADEVKHSKTNETIIDQIHANQRAIARESEVTQNQRLHVKKQQNNNKVSSDPTKEANSKDTQRVAQVKQRSDKERDEEDNDETQRESQSNAKHDQPSNSKNYNPQETDIEDRRKQSKNYTRHQQTNNAARDVFLQETGSKYTARQAYQQNKQGRGDPEQDSGNEDTRRQGQVNKEHQQNGNSKDVPPQVTGNGDTRRQGQIKEEHQQINNARDDPPQGTQNRDTRRQGQNNAKQQQTNNARDDPPQGTQNRDSRRQGQNNAKQQQTNNARDDPPQGTQNRDTRRQGQNNAKHQQTNNTRDDPPQGTQNRDTRRQGQNNAKQQQTNNARDDPPQGTQNRDTRRQGQNNAKQQQTNNARDDPPQGTQNRDTRRQGQNNAKQQQTNNARDDPQQETQNRDTRRQGQNNAKQQQTNNARDDPPQGTQNRDTRRQGQNNAKHQQTNNTRDDPQQETQNRDTRRQGQNNAKHQQTNNARDDPPQETQNRDTRRQGQNNARQQQTNNARDDRDDERQSRIQAKRQHNSYDKSVQLNPQTRPKPIVPTTLRKTGYLKQLPLISLEDLEDKKPNVLIVIVVLTSALRYDRRQGIRDTWWKQCKEPTAVCMFVTDGYIDETLHDGLLKEKKTYNDMLFLPVDEGLNFGMRLLFMMEWAQAKYKPEFFLRIDDDYFLCIERLLNELPQRPKKKVVWGFWHCDLPSVTFIDESFILLTFDLVETFLSWDESSLLCHPFGDQQLAIWLNHIPAINACFDIRLHHHPPASKTSKFSNMANICDRYLGLHGTYPNEMRKFWVVANDGKKRLTEWISVYPKACHYRPYFKWQDIKQMFRHKPELCMNNPRWTMKREMWVGRE